jgi:hypothetical protein
MISFDIRDSKQFTQWVRDNVLAGARAGAMSAAVKVISVIQNEIIPQENPVPVDIGTFRAGFRPEATPFGAVIVNTAPHAIFIDQGVRAENVKIGRKMLEALTQWIMRKGLGLQTKGEGVARVIVRPRTPKAKADYEAQARQMAWAIAQAMKRRGIFKEGAGLQISRKAIERTRGIVAQEMANEVIKALKAKGG